MRGPETRLRLKIVEALKKEFPKGYFRKIHGNQYQNVGIPDLLCCVESYFFGLEIKTESGTATPAQLLEIESIKRAGGAAGVIRTPEQAIQAVKSYLVKMRAKR